MGVVLQVESPEFWGLSLREKSPFFRNEHIPTIVLESAHAHFCLCEGYSAHRFDGVNMDGGDGGGRHATFFIQK